MSTGFDPRQQRTRAALFSAVLALAAEDDITEVTVTALAARAGLHRSTVYEHGGTPTEVLRRALALELDELRERHLRDVPPEGTSAALRDVVRGVFEHVDRHAAIYRNLDDVSGAILHSFLSSHFAASHRMLMAQASVVIPFALDGITAEQQRDAVVRYLADGFVGLIAAWLDTPEPRDPQVPVTLFSHLAPPWLPPFE